MESSIETEPSCEWWEQISYAWCAPHNQSFQRIYTWFWKEKEEKEARKPLRPTNNQKAKKHSRNCIQIR